MAILEEWKSAYDEVIRKICKPYDAFLDAGARAIPKGLESVCDLGVGTGGFIEKVARLNPGVQLIGMDHNPDSMEIARRKIKGLRTVQGNIFYEGKIPRADFYVSSLTLHHLEPALRNQRLLDIAEMGQGLINFDLMLEAEKDKGDLIAAVLDFVSPHFSHTDRMTLVKEIDEKDHPAYIEDDQLLFESNGYRFEILKKEFPFAVYKVTKA